MQGGRGEKIRRFRRFSPLFAGSLVILTGGNKKSGEKIAAPGKLSFTKRVYALLANLFAAEFAHFFTLAAKNAGFLALYKYDFVAVYIDFNGVVACDTHSFTHFLGYDYTAKLVYISYNTC
jgi:hypothetical protein